MFNLIFLNQFSSSENFKATKARIAPKTSTFSAFFVRFTGFMRWAAYKPSTRSDLVSSLSLALSHRESSHVCF